MVRRRDLVDGHIVGIQPSSCVVRHDQRTVLAALGRPRGGDNIARIHVCVEILHGYRVLLAGRIQEAERVMCRRRDVPAAVDLAHPGTIQVDRRGCRSRAMYRRRGLGGQNPAREGRDLPPSEAADKPRCVGVDREWVRHAHQSENHGHTHKDGYQE